MKQIERVLRSVNGNDVRTTSRSMQRDLSTSAAKINDALAGLSIQQIDAFGQSLRWFSSVGPEKLAVTFAVAEVIVAIVQTRERIWIRAGVQVLNILDPLYFKTSNNFPAAAVQVILATTDRAAAPVAFDSF